MAKQATNGHSTECGTCKFFRRQKVARPLGFCRERPPAVLMLGVRQNAVSGQQEVVTDTFWPMVPDTEWCGRHEPRVGHYADIDLSALKNMAEA